MPGVREPRPPALARVHRQRGFEMPLRVPPALHGRGEQAEVARRGAEARDVRGRDEIAALEGEELGVEDGSAFGVAEERAYFSEVGQAGHPSGVLRDDLETL